MDKYYIDWAFDIGEHVVDEKRDFTITDRFRQKDKNGYLNKYYKIKCNMCGFDSGEYYVKGQYRESWFCCEGDLKRSDSKRVNCPCCTSHIVKPGINDIPTTNPWMVDYFQNGYDDAKKYSSGSDHKETFKCVFCGRVNSKLYRISELNKRGLPCVCGDNFSYPNKFAYYLFENIKDQFSYYINEYSPNWASQYRYDNYIEKGNKKYIVEMDGNLGHGNMSYSGGNDVTGLQRDIIKDELARNHNIELIRIDCRLSDWKYISNNIINSRLSEIFDLSLVDYEEINAKCRESNIYKDICLYYEKNKDKTKIDIANELSVSKKVLLSALKVGTKRGWTDYRPQYILIDERRNEIVEYWKSKNGDIRASEIAKHFNIGSNAVKKALLIADKNNEINYDPSQESKLYHASRCKSVYVYDENGNLLKSYPSVAICANNSLNDFGIQFNRRNIAYVANGDYKSHKGYVFKYKQNDLEIA